MNLLDLAVKIGIDDQASGPLKKIGSGAGAMAKTVAKTAAAAAAAAGTAVAAIAKGAVDAYASYEQNVGGIQKLFGNMGKSLEDYAAMTGQTVDEASAKWQQLEQAQSLVLKNAQAAYKTAGLSANAYMQQVTSFSAALVTSLGGDTVKAAKYADIAMVDMSDNVNTFGSNVEDVQNAYQGFAKQNYTMLDNLKLGYGGTQSEMKRLIKDASQMTDVQKKLGVTVDESSTSFDNIVAAIHVMQESMQIGGTTSREAATTIEGSVNSMKAAWENWLTALGDSEDIDLSEVSEALIESIEDVAENVVPRLTSIIETVIQQLPSIVAELAPEVAQALEQIFDSAVQSLWYSLPDKLKVAVSSALLAIDESGLSATAKRLLDDVFNVDIDLSGVSDALSGFFTSDAFVNTLTVIDGLIRSVEDAFDGFASTFESNVVPALDDLGDSWGEFMGDLEPYIPTLEYLATGVGQVLAILLAGILEILTGIVDVADGVLQFFTDLGDGLDEDVQSFQDFVDGVGDTIGTLPETISTGLDGALTAVGDWAGKMAQKAGEAGSQFLEGIGVDMSQLPGNVSTWLITTISTVGEWVGQFGENATKAASKFGENLRTGLRSIPGTLGNIGGQIIQGIVNGITGAAGKVKEAVGNAIGNAVDFAKSLLGIASPSKVFKQFGYYTMKGLELGIDQNAGLPLSATERAMRAVASVEPSPLAAPAAAQAEGTRAVLEWLDGNLGDVIAQRTPYTGMRDLERIARRGVAYA